MKKSNVAVYIVLILASGFLLWLWFYLGLHAVDYPLDLVISIVWWVLIILSCIIIYRVEEKRRKVIRTSFITKGVLFNPEAGIVNYAADGVSALDALQKVLSNLNYGFDRNELPQGLSFDCIVRSEAFKPGNGAGTDDGVLQWVGEVAIPGSPDKKPMPFASKRELAVILEQLGLM